MSEEVKSSQSIQLQSNDAYGSIDMNDMNDIYTTPNTAYVLQEVDMSEEVNSSQNILLQFNEAYGSMHMDNIHTSPNTSYGQLPL